MLMKKLKNDLKKWRHISCPRTGRLYIVKMPIFLQNDLEVSCDSSQYPSKATCRHRQADSKIHMEGTDLRQRRILRKKSKVEGITIPDIYVITMVIKTVWRWQKDRHKDQQNRIDNKKDHPKMLK